jgi:hypothetical protein
MPFILGKVNLSNFKKSLEENGSKQFNFKS